MIFNKYIRCYRDIPTSNLNTAMSIVRKKHPYARLITHSINPKNRLKTDKIKKSRTLTVIIVTDYRKLREDYRL